MTQTKTLTKSQSNGTQKKITVPLRKHPTNANMATVELIKISLEQPPQGGFTTPEIRSRLKVMDKIDELNPESTVIELDENEHKILLDAVGLVRWAKLDKFIIEFEDSLK